MNFSQILFRQERQCADGNHDVKYCAQRHGHGVNKEPGLNVSAPSSFILRVPREKMPITPLTLMAMSSVMGMVVPSLAKG